MVVPRATFCLHYSGDLLVDTLLSSFNGTGCKTIDYADDLMMTGDHDLGALVDRIRLALSRLEK